jgi:hypothetical protein
VQTFGAYPTGKVSLLYASLPSLEPLQSGACYICASSRAFLLVFCGSPTSSVQRHGALTGQSIERRFDCLGTFQSSLAIQVSQEKTSADQSAVNMATCCSTVSRCFLRSQPVSRASIPQKAVGWRDLVHHLASKHLKRPQTEHALQGARCIIQ